MKNVQKMTKGQVVAWMDKTVKRIAFHQSEGGDGNSRREQIIITRYQGLKEFMQDCGVWLKYCDLRCIDPENDGYDQFEKC